jgi:hypothetical protein
MSDINLKPFPEKIRFHKLAALKLAKERNEALFKLTAEGPSIMHVRLLEEIGEELKLNISIDNLAKRLERLDPHPHPPPSS